MTNWIRFDHLPFSPQSGCFRKCVSDHWDASQPGGKLEQHSGPTKEPWFTSVQQEQARLETTVLSHRWHKLSCQMKKLSSQDSEPSWQTWWVISFYLGVCVRCNVWLPWSSSASVFACWVCGGLYLLQSDSSCQRSGARLWIRGTGCRSFTLIPTFMTFYH